MTKDISPSESSLKNMLTPEQVIEQRKKYGIDLEAKPQINVETKEQRLKRFDDALAKAKQAKMEAEVQAKEQAISDQKAQDPMRQGVIGKTLGAGFDVLKGAAKGVASTVVGMGELGTKLNPFISKESKKKTSEFAQGLREDQLKARGGAEQAGKTIEQIAEFFIPASASLKAGQAASVAVKGGKLLKGAAKIGAIGATEGVLGTGQSAMQSGKLGADELATGAVSLVAPAALVGAGRIAKIITPQPIKAIINEAVDKALRPSKKSITDPKFYDKADDAFHILARNKILTDDAGKLRNPETRSETLDVLKNAKKKIYEEYSSLADVATGKGAQINTQPIIADTINLVKDKGWSVDVKEYAIKQARSLSDLEGASPAKIQDRIEELNNNFNPFATGKDKVRTEIDASIARRLRQALDEAIEKTEGEGYQALRNEYASLKTIENDLINASAVEARKNKAGLVDFTDIFTGGNILGSVVTGNPAMLAQGLGGRGVKEFIKWLNDPNRYLKNAFNAIEKNPNFRKQMGGATQKALTEGVTQTPTVQVPINLPAKAQSTIDKEELDLAIKSMDKRQLFEALNKLDEQDLKLMLTEGTSAFPQTPIELPAKGMSTSNKIEYPRK